MSGQPGRKNIWLYIRNEYNICRSSHFVCLVVGTSLTMPLRLPLYVSEQYREDILNIVFLLRVFTLIRRRLAMISGSSLSKSIKLSLTVFILIQKSARGKAQRWRGGEKRLTDAQTQVEEMESQMAFSSCFFPIYFQKLCCEFFKNSCQIHA